MPSLRLQIVRSWAGPSLRTLLILIGVAYPLNWLVPLIHSITISWWILVKQQSGLQRKTIFKFESISGFHNSGMPPRADSLGQRQGDDSTKILKPEQTIILYQAIFYQVSVLFIWCYIIQSTIMSHNKYNKILNNIINII